MNVIDACAKIFWLTCDVLAVEYRLLLTFLIIGQYVVEVAATASSGISTLMKDPVIGVTKAHWEILHWICLIYYFNEFFILIIVFCLYYGTFWAKKIKSNQIKSNQRKEKKRTSNLCQSWRIMKVSKSCLEALMFSWLFIALLDSPDYFSFSCRKLFSPLHTASWMNKIPSFKACKIAENSTI